jgi:hypothetical protein
MIQINCTQCRELLQIDDAFAGGVCRCKFCGAIQTVPKRLKGSGAEEIGEASAGGTTTATYRRTATDAPSGTGLDDLAGIVASSSGLSSGRLQKKLPSARVTAAARREGGGTRKSVPAPKRSNTTMIIAAAGGVIALLLVVIIVMATRDKGGPEAAANPDGGTSGGTTPPSVVGPNNTNNNNVIRPPVVRGPSFLGQPLTEASVVYVLDRGQASASESRLDLLKKALASSLKSLGPQRRFAVMFWHVRGEKGTTWPARGLQNATPENISTAMAEVDQVYATGQTRPPDDLDKAFKSGAEAVVYVPIKSFAPDEKEIIEPVRKARGNSKAKVYCFSLESSDLGPMLGKLAGETKGAYRDVPLGALREMGAE